MNQEQRYSALRDFEGYGNLETASVLFIGYEESDPFLTQSDLDKFLEGWQGEPWYSQKWKRPEGIKGITETVQARLSLRLRGKGDATRDYNFCNQAEFCANIYPLGAPGENQWPIEYVDWLGMSKYCFHEKIDAHRAEVLRHLISRFVESGQYIFIMGKKAREFFLKHNIFPTEQNPQRKITFQGRRPATIWHSVDCHNWFTGHPSHGWFNEQAIEEILRSRRRGRS